MKNTSAGLCAKNAGGAYMREGGGGGGGGRICGTLRYINVLTKCLQYCRWPLFRSAWL